MNQAQLLCVIPVLPVEVAQYLLSFLTIAFSLVLKTILKNAAHFGMQ
jgi:hypothetical protein